jgi:hypothetical protein
VKLIKDDLLLGSRDVGLGGGDIGVPHIQGYGSHLSQLLRGELAVVLLQTLLTTVRAQLGISAATAHTAARRRLEIPTEAEAVSD